MRTLTRDGVALAYEEAGRGDPPLLLVHCWAGDHTTLAPQAGHFRRAHRVVAVDLRGHGQSDRPHQDYTVAGFADEVAPGAMLARTLLDEPVVFFRDGAGTVKALADRCTHRFAPLSMGKLCDGVVQCPYHGMRFDGSGACVHNPHGDGSVPKASKLKSYAVVERDGLLWWWAGEDDAADAALIPDYGAITSAPADATLRGYMPATPGHAATH